MVLVAVAVVVVTQVVIRDLEVTQVATKDLVEEIKDQEATLAVTNSRVQEKATNSKAQVT